MRAGSLTPSLAPSARNRLAGGAVLWPVLIAETGPVTEGLRVREIDDDEGRRLLRIVRRGTGPVVTWRRAQMVLLSAQGMDVAAIAKVAFTSEDRVRDVLHNFNADGFGSLCPRYKGGRPPAAIPASRAAMASGCRRSRATNWNRGLRRPWRRCGRSYRHGGRR
jgi:hypothetical protein